MDKYINDAIAWLRAWRHRCCPPSAVLHGRLDVQLREHLQLCPWCRQDREDGPLDIVIPAVGQQFPDQPEAAPGQLWSLAPGLADWGPKGRYYTPPVVLIVNRPDEHALTVIQTYDDPLFAGTGDLALDNGLNGFAQPWNRYTVRRTDLGYYLGRITEGLLRKLRQLPPVEEKAPETGSLLWFFRQMEVETGFFFAAAAVADLMIRYEREHDRPENILRYESLEEMNADLRHLPLVFPSLSGRDLTPLLVLARSHPADDLLPLVAAEAGDRVIALVFTVESGRITGVTVRDLLVDHLSLSGDMLHLSGTMSEPADPGLDFFFFWQVGEQLIEPVPGQAGFEDDVFWAAFPVHDVTEPMQGSLVVRILDQR
ncbi:MAG: hypothetical protein RBR09_13535 [Desulfobulbaceae bacterium]|jgi:hypothetical protein|nr:hypothetical protein [Deltaproteobacteria bacterium]MDY0352271.1 hypothetical protein [Desulfobulbaceae bacterium]